MVFGVGSHIGRLYARYWARCWVGPVLADKSHRGYREKLLTRIKLRAVKPMIRWSRSMTLGARVAVIDGEERFLLVKHSYSTPWIFPGGGVEKGETCEAAALREMQEEAAVVAMGPLQLHGIFSNHADFPGDHLAFYVCRQFERKPFVPNREIAAAEFFAVDALPPIVSAGSRRRIEELVSGRAPSDTW
jgi:8-oxo-dGTP pyrophosphatase MutT (NUDIX family)